MIRKEPCPTCRKNGGDHSGDNRVVYKVDEHNQALDYWCFSCGKGHLPSKEPEVYETTETIMTFGQKQWQTQKIAIQQSKGDEPHIGYGFRGIPDDVYKIFGVLNEVRDGTKEVVAQYYPLTETVDGVPVICGTKIREVPKKFYAKGKNKGSSTQLFGQALAQKAGKDVVVIASGECFTGDVEVLTEKGFIPFRHYKDEKVLTVTTKGDSKYLDPEAVIKKRYEGDLVLIDHEHYKVKCTPLHHLAFKDGVDRELQKVQADRFIPNDLYFNASTRFVTTPTKKYDPSYYTLVGAYIHAGLKDLETLEVDDKEHLEEQLRALNTSPLTSLDFNYILYKASYEEKRWVVESLLHKADGCFEVFLPEVKDFLDILCVTAGCRLEHQDGMYTYRYVLHMSTKGLQDSKVIIPEFKGSVYCVQSKTGYIVIRYQGVVSVVGNCDAMASFAMLRELGKDCPAVVSTTIGEGGVAQYRAQYDFFDSFNKIIIIPDQDEAGKKALDDAVQALPRDKVYVVELPVKDANDMLVKGLVDEFLKRYRKAKPYVPDGIVGSSALYQRTLEACEMKSIPLPKFMEGMNDMLPSGFVLESIVNLAAASGIGKSTFINQLVYSWIFEAPYKIGVVSLELSAGQYGTSLLSTHLKTKINNMPVADRKEFLERPEIKQKAEELFKLPDGEDRFYLVEERENKIETVQKTIEKLIISCGVKVIVIDPLQDILAGLDIAAQEEHMAWQKSIIKKYGLLLVNVCHTRKAGSGEKAGSTGGMISEESIQGTSSIYKSGSINILFTRNKLAETAVERNTTMFFISKNRWSGHTGPAGAFVYDNDENWLYPEEEFKLLNPELYLQEVTPEELIALGLDE